MEIDRRHNDRTLNWLNLMISQQDLNIIRNIWDSVSAQVNNNIVLVVIGYFNPQILHIAVCL